MANAYREVTGIGQHVDVSAQESIIRLSLNAIPFYEMAGTVFRREGRKRMLVRNSPITQIWPVKDGFIDFMLKQVEGGGPAKKDG
jgi:crotonobetainyl-CoA:carnitine CoA-transferase CaiB-like acyl-CoA transferase